MLCQTRLALADEAKGKIKAVNADKKEFVLTDTNNKDWTFELTKDAKLTCDDKPCTLADLKAGDRVTIMYEKKADVLWASKVAASRK
jgi:hypothetical protein